MYVFNGLNLQNCIKTLTNRVVPGRSEEGVYQDWEERHVYADDWRNRSEQGVSHSCNKIILCELVIVYIFNRNTISPVLLQSASQLQKFS